MARSKNSAAALDFFIWGAGHAYLGERKALFFPWVFWTIGLVIWNAIGLVIWVSGGFYSYTTVFGIDEITGVNYAGAFAFWFIPTLLVGGLLAYSAYTSQNTLAGLTNTPLGGRLRRSQSQVPEVPQQGPEAVMAPTTATGQTGTFCRTCGAANTSGDAFCSNCGAPLARAPVSATTSASTAQPATTGSPTGVVCPNCGTLNPVGNSFCKRCGNKIA